jgi:hypothetical protein
MQDTSTAKRLVLSGIELDGRWVRERRHLVVKTTTKAGGKFLNHTAARRTIAAAAAAR